MYIIRSPFWREKVCLGVGYPYIKRSIFYKGINVYKYDTYIVSSSMNQDRNKHNVTSSTIHSNAAGMASTKITVYPCICKAAIPLSAAVSPR